MDARHPAVGEVKSKRVRLRGTTNGRVDLIAQFDDGFIAVESKIHWFNNMGAFQDVLGRLEDAESDARSIDPNFVGRRLALCFGVLEKGGVDLKQLLRSAVADSESAGIDVIVWFVNTSSSDSVQYPGCMILGRVVV